MKRFITVLPTILTAGSLHAALSVNPTSLYTFDTGNGTADARATLNLTTAGTLTEVLFGSGVDTSPAGNIFKGPANSANTGTTSDLTQPGTGDFPLSFRYKAGSALPTTYTHLLWQGGLWAGDSNYSGYTFQYNAAGTVGLYVGNLPQTSRPVAISTATMTTNAWNNLAMVRSGTSLTLYLNGVAYSTTLPSDFNIAVNNAGNQWYREFSIGKSPTGYGGIAGSVIDDVGVWKGAALTAGDIAQIYNNGAGASIASLIAVPEPSLYGLPGAGALAGAALVRRRRKV